MTNSPSLHGRTWYAIGGVVALLLVGGVIASTSTMHQDGRESRVAEVPALEDEVRSTSAMDEKQSWSRDVLVQTELKSIYNDEVMPKPVRKRLTRSDMFSEDWPVDPGANVASLGPETYRFKNLEVLYLPRRPALITIRKKTPPNQVVAIVSTERFVQWRKEGEVLMMDRQEGIARVQPFVDEYMEKLYLFITFGNSHVGWLGKVYESDIFGNDVRELGKETVWHTSGVEDFRFSPDRTTLSYVAEETDAKINETTGIVEQVGDDRIVFHIIDLLDTEKSVQFTLPHGEKLLGYGKGRVWVHAWQFVDDDAVEFTLYHQESTEKQDGVIELWRYNRETGESTLIESRAVTRES